ncbi:hypothetical protein [Pelagerythrobacter marinus]|uniref:hypothetical protein n=1 Tax=Pelagerythrobacter marinus TaxID=538382 RepID=UPI002AC98F8A|nr:hypothetical protein [Pelagerythrobacter marinus]WPZ05638.1 hypothetical protein T8T98_09365 [Pelagerythrobacter marinus]
MNTHIIAALVIILSSGVALATTILWLRERSRHRKSKRFMRQAVQLADRRASQIDRLENQAASDGNRLSELRVRNAELTTERNTLRDKIAKLQPLADKAIAAQQQRLRASQAAAQKRRKAKVAAQ